MYLLQLILNSIVLGTQVLLVAVSLYLIHSVSRIFHLALGAIGASVAYTAWAFRDNVPLALLASIGVALLLGFISYRLLNTFAEKQEPLFGLIISFSFGVGLEALISILFGTDGKSFSNGVLSTVGYSGVNIATPGLITIVLGIVLAIIAFIGVRFTPWGRIIRSIAEHPYALEALGVNQRTVRLIVYCIASLLVGFVVTMTGLYTALTPLMGFNLIVTGFVALLVGGVLDIRGTVIASYLVVLIPELAIGLSGGSYNISPSWRVAMVFVVAIIALSIRPNGLLTANKRVI